MGTVKWVRSPFIKVSKVKVYEKIKGFNQKKQRVFFDNKQSSSVIME